MPVHPAQASKYLVHALTGRGSWTTLFMTHPPVERRIARLIDLR
jgi:Zn-dependent protease with chaperone function